MADCTIVRAGGGGSYTGVQGLDYGAGISAESGVPTFRDADGLWEGHRVEDVATPDAYERQPAAVHRFYDARRTALDAVEPNTAHVALARLEEVLGDDLLVVTQNIDDLHERGGSTRVLHMHGKLRSALCRGCRQRVPWLGDLGDFPPCPRCGVSEEFTRPRWLVTALLTRPT